MDIIFSPILILFLLHSILLSANAAFSSIFNSHSNSKTLVHVNTLFGRLRGFVHQLGNNGQKIDVFLGVPFARPPIGPLRFEKPKRLKKWMGIKMADTAKPACIYHASPPGLANGKKDYAEDCLYLNIFAAHKSGGEYHKNAKSNSQQPVLVLIHGGGFEVGSSSDYQNYEDIGTKFVSRGIVVVSIAYRLGWIGFGSSGDRHMPGNLGLWDQLAALHFIRDNIRAFGGDPNRITLYGYSAGSASVSLLSISPHSRALFHRSIQMSGSPFSAWALNQRTVNETRRLARELGCHDWAGGKQLKRCLGRKSVPQIWAAMDRIGPTRYDDVNFSKFSPRVDGDFLPEDLPELIGTAPPKPTLIGFVELESLCWTLFTGANTTLAAFAVPWVRIDSYDRRQFEAFVRQLVAKPEFFGSIKRAREAQEEIVGQYLREDMLAEISQLNGINFNHYFLQRYTQVLSDLNFIVAILLEVRQKSALGWPLYFYQNVHYNPLEFPKPVKVHQNFHTNDENLLFYESHFPINFELTEEDKMVEAHLVDMVASFVKFGDPSPKGIRWSNTSSNNPNRHLRIMAQPMMEEQLEADLRNRYAFWQRIREKYGKRWDPVRGAKAGKK